MTCKPHDEEKSAVMSGWGDRPDQ